MQKLIFYVPLLLTLTFHTPLFTKIREWQRNQLSRELDPIDSQFFHPTLLQQVLPIIQSLNKKRQADHGIYLVEIRQNQTIYINGESIDNLSSSLAMLMKLLKKIRKCPPCIFLFTRNGENFSGHPDLNDLPVLVGSKFLPGSFNQILFIEEASTIGGRHGKKYDGAQSIQDVLAYRDKENWEEKIPRLIWRGMITDFRHKKELIFNHAPYKISPRIIIHALSAQYPKLINGKLTFIGFHTEEYFKTLGIHSLIFEPDKRYDKKNENGFIILNPEISIRQHLKYRYQIALDGVHATNPGYAWRLLSGTLTIKQDSPYVQWFYAGLKPWVHYVPVERYLDNLIEILQWAQHNDSETKTIAQNAKTFGDAHLLIKYFYEHAHFVLQRYSQKQQQAISTY